MNPKYTVNMQFHMTLEETRAVVFAAGTQHHCLISITRFGPPRAVTHDLLPRDLMTHWPEETAPNIIELRFPTTAGAGYYKDLLVWNLGVETSIELLEHQVTGGTNSKSLYQQWKRFISEISRKLPVRGYVKSYFTGAVSAKPKRLVSASAVEKASHREFRLLLIGQNEVVLQP